MTEPDQDGLVSEYETFAMLPEWILDAEISDRAVRLFALLLRYANKGGKAWPTRKTLQERLRVGSLDSVDRAVKELVELGALEVVRRGGAPGTAFTSSVYVLKRRPSRTGAATPSRTDAATLAAPVRHERESPERENTPPASQVAPAKSPKRRTRIPDGWTPDEDLLAWTAENTPGLNLDYEVAQFVDHHAARGSTFIDWRRAWQKWARQAAQPRPGRTVPNRQAADTSQPEHAERAAAWS